MAGAVGLEPTNGGSKGRCLTIWRRPKNFFDLSAFGKNSRCANPRFGSHSSVNRFDIMLEQPMQRTRRESCLACRKKNAEDRSATSRHPNTDCPNVPEMGKPMAYLGTKLNRCGLKIVDEQGPEGGCPIPRLTSQP